MIPGHGVSGPGHEKWARQPVRFMKLVYSASCWIWEENLAQRGRRGMSIVSVRDLIRETLSSDGTCSVSTRSSIMHTTWKQQVYGLEPYEEVGCIEWLLALVRTD